MRLDWSINKAYVFGVYEPDVVAAMRAYVKQGMTAVDCGAHIGYFTLLLVKLVGETGKIYAFEPLPKTMRCCVRTSPLTAIATSLQRTRRLQKSQGLCD